MPLGRSPEHADDIKRCRELPPELETTASVSIFLAEGACAVQEMTAEIEAMLLPLGARPHWGKITHTPRRRSHRCIRSCKHFRTSLGHNDPDGKFLDEFLDTHGFG
jgi:hypothetical protein